MATDANASTSRGGVGNATPNLSYDAMMPSTTPPTQQAARLISLVLHPFLVAPVAIAAILWFDLGDPRSALGWAGLCAAMVVAPARLRLLGKLRRHEVRDADLSHREERFGLYGLGALCMLLCYGALRLLGAPELLQRGFRAALLAVLAAIVVNRFWTKVSIHAGVMAGVTLAMLPYHGPLAVVLAGATLLVTWARLVLHQHTVSQVLLGWLIAAAAVAAALVRH